MPVLSRNQLCNRALGRIKAGQIADYDEQSLSAEKCRLYYPEVLGDMLEGNHDWSFATQRVRPAQLLVNDRPGEWQYAYQLPSNMAGGSAIRVIPDLEAAGLAIPVPLPGEPYSEAWSVSGNFIETPYVIEGSALYSNVADATLVYGVNDIAGISVPNKVITAFALDLASRLAVPIKNDKERESTLQAAARAAWEDAIADDRNRQPQHTGQYVSETMLARQGYLSELP